MTDQATLAAADQASRRWTAPAPGAIRPGSTAHKTAFCGMLLETHNRYKPSISDWPELEPAARDRVAGLPFWNLAVQTEVKAKIRVLSYADMIQDPLLREAIELMGFEEGRHKNVLSNLAAAYDIELAPDLDYPRPDDPEWAFMLTGFGECVDSFFGFGLFAVALRSSFFPPELVNTLEPVMQEEARHILFFVNWVAWHRHNLPWFRRLGFWAKIARAWIQLARQRIAMARGSVAAPRNNNFIATGHKAVSNVDLSIATLFDICLEENERRFAGYDPRLLRPLAVPRFVRLARRAMRIYGVFKPRASRGSNTAA
jgi:hypothetical protein